MNPDGSINVSAIGPDGTPGGGGFSGLFGGICYVNGDPNNGPTPPQSRKPDVFDKCAAQGQAAAAPYWNQAKTGFGLDNFYGGGISAYLGYLGKGAIGGVYGFIGGYLAKPVGTGIAGQQAYDSATTSCLNANGIDTNAYIK